MAEIILLQKITREPLFLQPNLEQTSFPHLAIDDGDREKVEEVNKTDYENADVDYCLGLFPYSLSLRSRSSGSKESPFREP